MRKKFFLFVSLLTMLSIVSAQALASRANLIVPSLTFNSTTATCIVAVDASTGADITVELNF